MVEHCACSFWYHWCNFSQAAPLWFIRVFSSHIECIVASAHWGDWRLPCWVVWVIKAAHWEWLRKLDDWIECNQEYQLWQCVTLKQPLLTGNLRVFVWLHELSIGSKQLICRLSLPLGVWYEPSYPGVVLIQKHFWGLGKWLKGLWYVFWMTAEVEKMCFVVPLMLLW